MSDPTREATCPCAGRCHHDTHPCSLGCWAAQKPWRAEAAALSTTPAPLDVERLARALHINAGHRDKHPDFRGCTVCSPAAEAIAREYAKP